MIVLLSSIGVATAQIDITGYHLVYSSESAETASALLDLTDEELACCTGDFLSRDKFERNWLYCPRATSKWNKRMAENDEDRAKVHLCEDGKLRLLALSLDGTKEGCITSGIKMKQGYKYGIFEIKAKCNPHASNFPAVWMMPSQPNGGWPNCGEIDIMEQIGTSSTVYSTVHVGARYEQKVGKNYQWSGSKWFDDGYHVYSLLWDKRSLTFYTDGIQVFRYEKDFTLDYAAHPDYEHAQFPYNEEFYIILDQALGTNAWWGNEDPDPEFVYEMTVDYVRIWQTEEAPVVLEYKLLRNNSDPKRFMAATDDNLLTTVEGTGEPWTDNMLFAMVPTDAGGKYYLLTKDGRYVGYKADANKQIDLGETGTPYYVIEDDTKGIAFDYAKQTAPFTYADGSRALFMNNKKDNIVTISGSTKEASWWKALSPEEVVEATAITHHSSPNTHHPSPIYNLQGQRVQKASHGVYIVNGRKVIR